ncbi:hypothetical protein PJ900_23790 [Tistrella mobilis]|uniref:Lipoprotein n=1 Tax=Tistrella mobilis TaxID=171437 RepID=A0A161Q7Z3_9PROT|nr:hypothetical protein [Tistrella mobilis]KYO57329.1 hypothetical protein AUP44_20715 [Tistrella mobilis]
MNRISRLAGVVAIASMSAACASITAGTTQSIAVQTAPEQGAQCELRNDKGTWSVPATPGSSTVTKSYGDLTIVCSTPTGWKGTTSLVSETAGAAFGNIIAGGIIGAAVDMSSGAAYKYPSAATVMLSRPAELPATDAAPAATDQALTDKERADKAPADKAPATPAETPVSLLPGEATRRAGSEGLRRMRRV